MPRKAEIDRPVKLHTALPESLRTRLDLFLWSEVEGKVPKGKHQEFIIARIVAFFNSRRLELQPYGFPEGFFVEGPKEMIEALEARMKEKVSG